MRRLHTPATEEPLLSATREKPVQQQRPTAKNKQLNKINKIKNSPVKLSGPGLLFVENFFFYY